MNDTTETVEILVDGQAKRVPAEVTLFRALQSLNWPIRYEKVCWNGHCGDCVVGYRDAAEKGPIQRALACRLLVRDGMQIETLPSACRK